MRRPGCDAIVGWIKWLCRNLRRNIMIISYKKWADNTYYFTCYNIKKKKFLVRQILLVGAAKLPIQRAVSLW